MTSTTTTASALRAEIQGALSTAGLSKIPPEILSQCELLLVPSLFFERHRRWTLVHITTVLPCRCGTID